MGISERRDSKRLIHGVKARGGKPAVDDHRSSILGEAGKERTVQRPAKMVQGHVLAQMHN